jgi:predicted nucleotidyltransferase
MLARLCSEGILDPDPQQPQRYRVRQSGLVIDVISPDGMNVPGDKWLRQAADNHRAYDLEEGMTVRAVTPAYFIVLKLAAFLDRASDPVSSKDMEDIVFVAAEVPGLAEEIEAASLTADVAELWRRAFSKHHLSIADLDDVVDAHLGAQERTRRGAVVDLLKRIALG